MSRNKLKTLQDFVDACVDPAAPFGFCNPDTAGWLRDAAREWIKYYERQRELHWEMINKGIGENSLCEVPSGFDVENSMCAIHPDEYESHIKWIKHFFNLEDKS